MKINITYNQINNIFFKFIYNKLNFRSYNYTLYYLKIY